MEFEVAIACVLTVLLWILFRKTVGKWCDEYTRFEEKDEKDEELREPADKDPNEEE